MINTLYALNSLVNNKNMVRKKYNFLENHFMLFIREKLTKPFDTALIWFSKNSVNKNPVPTLILHTLLNEGYPCESENPVPTLILHTLLNEGYPCESENHCPWNNRNRIKNWRNNHFKSSFKFDLTKFWHNDILLIRCKMQDHVLVFRITFSSKEGYDGW